jgi:hypothetical protein
MTFTLVEFHHDLIIFCFIFSILILLKYSDSIYYNLLQLKQELEKMLIYKFFLSFIFVKSKIKFLKKRNVIVYSSISIYK